MILFRMGSEKGVNMKNKVIFGCVGVLSLGIGLLTKNQVENMYFCGHADIRN